MGMYDMLALRRILLGSQIKIAHTCDYAIFTVTNYLNSLRNINLFNVATSRAQKLTFVILDEKYSNPFYNRQNLPPQIANYLEKVIEDNMFIRI